MFEDVLKTVQSQINERLSSPLMGSFVISWCFWNYKFLVILFSAASVTNTFLLVNSIAFPDTTSVVLNGVIYPLLTAALYIFVYPYPAKYVYKFTRKKQKEILEIKRRIEDETPLTLEESRKIRSDLFKVELEYSQELEQKDKEIERLKSEIASTRSVLPTETAPSNSVSPVSITPSQLSLLRQVEHLKGQAPEKRLISQSQESQVKTEFDLGELEKMGFLTHRYKSSLSDNVYEFTHDGRSYLVRHQEADA
ncbi:MAG TPA: hypothetical protein VMV75_06125 [Sulfuricella sp.]|nr:hypothetical protein [Sulfuricella sp.]